MLKVHKKSAHNTYNHNVIQKLNTQNAKYKSFFFFFCYQNSKMDSSKNIHKNILKKVEEKKRQGRKKV